jgi:hypothetical protein
MGLLISVFAALGALQTAAEILMGFPQLRGLWRSIRTLLGVIGRRLDYAAAQRMPVTRPDVPATPGMLRRRERLAKIRRFARWLARAEPRREEATLRLSLKDTRQLRALGLDSVVRELERRSRR